ncbi:MAG: CoB--CoM heterodisulfide reductase iron-sulfur subunit B family protein [Anaerolineae bacterium]|nr:CoB--CoM heterodisulfide reductase iron-sulfur subunit B family protein [Anaerolineae bacterium]
MGVPYYPGCTLSTNAKGYDRSGRAVAAALGMELVELPEWQCCGATFPLATDNSLALIAPTRILYQAEQQGDRVAALCAICYHVLKRTQTTLARDTEMHDRINWFTEQDYQGRVTVSHLLEILRDDVGWEALAQKVVRPLTGLRAAPYYGCLLLRPYDEIGMDDPENPSILHDLLRALGAEVVDFPYNIECCGSYLTVKEPGISENLSQDIVASARDHQAQVIVTACPLCQFNLEYPQREKASGRTGDEIPVVYFTQLMAVALGLPEEEWGMETGHFVDPRPLFNGK